MAGERMCGHLGQQWRDMGQQQTRASIRRQWRQWMGQGGLDLPSGPVNMKCLTTSRLIPPMSTMPMT